MTVTWWTASGIILHHWSIAYKISTYYSSLIYFSVSIAIITTKYQKHYFYYCYLLLSLPLLSYYFATKYFAADIKFPGVVELTTHLLISYLLIGGTIRASMLIHIIKNILTIRSKYLIYPSPIIYVTVALKKRPKLAQVARTITHVHILSLFIEK